MFSTAPVSLSSLLYSTVSTLFWSCLLFCVLVGFVFNWLIFLVSLAHQVTLTFCLWIVLVLLLCMYVCVYVCLWRGVGGWACSFGFNFICLILHLPFVLGSLFVSCFCLLVLISFIAITDLGSLAIDWAWASGVRALSPGQYTARECLASKNIY